LYQSKCRKPGSLDLGGLRNDQILEIEADDEDKDRLEGDLDEGEEVHRDQAIAFADVVVHDRGRGDAKSRIKDSVAEAEEENGTDADRLLLPERYPAPLLDGKDRNNPEDKG
jgi:hypothetical protein